MKKIDITISGHKIDTRRHKFAHVSVNSHVIRSNAKNRTDEPPIRVAKSQSDKHPIYAREVEISGPSKLVYSADDSIMKCGARLVLVTPYEYVKVVR